MDIFSLLRTDHRLMRRFLPLTILFLTACDPPPTMHDPWNQKTSQKPAVMSEDVEDEDWCNPYGVGRDTCAERRRYEDWRERADKCLASPWTDEEACANRPIINIDEFGEDQ